MRWERVLANLGYGSRREVATLLKQGLLTQSDGSVVAAQPPVDWQDLRFAGEPLDPPAPLLLLMNKPTGYVCSTSSLEGPTVYELLPPRFARRKPQLVTVGRLDKDTSGLLLFCDDGALVHQLTSPKKKVWKTYEATLARPLEPTQAEQLAGPSLLLVGETKPCLPARLEVIGPQLVRLAICEGRYHQVRRMFAAVGNHVESLRRVSIGELQLAPDLEPGQWRKLSLLALGL